MKCKSGKGEQNEHLKELFRKYNFFVIDNCKLIKVRHLNKSDIYLIQKGSTVLGESFSKYVDSLFNLYDYKCTNNKILTAEYMSKSFSKYADKFSFVRKHNPNGIIIAQLNINSLRRKLRMT